MVAVRQEATARPLPAPVPGPNLGVVGEPEPVRQVPRRAPKPQTRPVAPPARRSASRVANPVRVSVSIAIAAIVVFGLVLVNIYLAQVSLGLSEVQGRVAEEQSRQRSLRNAVAVSESPERIAQMARELGLVAPVHTQPIE